jgi:hypothetical protein
MTKKRSIFFGLIAAIIGGLSFYFLIDKEDQNQIFVTVDNSLTSDKVRIHKGFYSINSGSDENLIKLGLDKIIYSDNSVKSFETICGETIFLLFMTINSMQLFDILFRMTSMTEYLNHTHTILTLKELKTKYI